MKPSTVCNPSSALVRKKDTYAFLGRRGYDAELEQKLKLLGFQAFGPVSQNALDCHFVKGHVYCGRLVSAEKALDWLDGKESRRRVLELVNDS